MSNNQIVDKALNYLGDKENKKDIGVYIDISSYTSTSNAYIIPEDGYINAYAGASTNSVATVKIYGPTSDNSYIRMGGYSNSTYPSWLIYVKKGMKAITEKAENGGVIRYYPLV